MEMHVEGIEIQKWVVTMDGVQIVDKEMGSFV